MINQWSCLYNMVLATAMLTRLLIDWTNIVQRQMTDISSLFFSGLRVSRSLVSCVVFCWSLYLLFLLNITASVALLLAWLPPVRVGRGFELRSGQAKDYKIGSCCFSTKPAALRRKTKDWLARNQNNVSVWSDTSTRGLLFWWVSTMINQPSA